MTKHARALIGACLLIICVAGAVFAQGSMAATRANEPLPVVSVAPIPADEGAYVPGELIVGLADEGDSGSMADEVRHAIEMRNSVAIETLAQSSQDSGTTLLVMFDDAELVGDDLAQAAQSIAAVQDVSHVQPNYSYSTAADEVRAASVAEDEDVAKQYYLNGPSDHGANVATAWGLIDTDKKVDVAVLDTGVYVMPEYDDDGKLVKNAKVLVENFHQEFDSSNLDIAHGVDIVHSAGTTLLPLVNESNPYGDDNGHGTHVSAIIAANAKTANTPRVVPMGIAGVSHNARVIPVKVLDAGGEGSTADFVKAYDYLINLKASGKLPNLHVVNMSLSLSFEAEDDEEGAEDDQDDGEGEPPADLVEEEDDELSGDDDALKSKIEQAANIGIATVCAAGNEGSSAETYPSDYDACISVTALDENGRNASYSNLNRYKDISAPGSGIYSAWGSQADAYATLDGTSQATAIVSGVLSMLWAKNAYLTVGEVKEAIYSTARIVPGDGGSLGLTASAAGAAGAAGSGLTAPVVSAERNGSHGAIDAAAAIRWLGGLSAKAANPMKASAVTSIIGRPYSASKQTLSVASVFRVSNVKGAVTYAKKSGDAGITVGENGILTIAAKKAAGTYPIVATVISSGTKKYKPSAVDVSFKVKIAPKKRAVPSGAKLVYTGRKQVGVKAGAGYKLSGTVKATKAGSYKAKATLTSDYVWNDGTATVKTVSWSISPAALKSATLSKTSCVYTGSSLKPGVTVKALGKKLKKGSDYTVSYASNKNPGIAKVTVKGVGNYKGSLKRSFAISLGKANLGNMKAGKSSFTATWSRQKTGNVGYQVRYSLKSSMKGAVSKVVSKNATTKLTVNRLKKGKKYYVQIRTFKKISGKRCYSSWSAKKAVKVR